ncbi:hypothetical protein LSAT2_008869, partial [Lamellibrachia satsuma]
MRTRLVGGGAGGVKRVARENCSYEALIYPTQTYKGGGIADRSCPQNMAREKERARLRERVRKRKRLSTD